jgi:hypothetical protein
MALQLSVGPWPLFQFLNLVQSRSVARTVLTHSTTQTQIKCTQISTPCMGFEPTIPGFLASEECSCLRPRGHYDRLREGLELDSVAIVRKGTILTERPQLVGEVNANFCGQGVSSGQRNGFPQPLISVL